ncbi:MAG TPA: 3'-5' exonuclease [Opitutales bacterium]|nr:3'-5' exonuclease [Opitutales bacterium]
MSSPTPFPTTIAREQVNALPLARYEGPITVISNPREVHAAVDYLRDETLLGFDTESRPSFRRGDNHPVALLQLAGAEKVYLFQLHQIEHLDPVLALLADPAIRKAGVAIRDDIRKLQELGWFVPANFVEISDLSRRLDVSVTGLRNLTAMFLGYRVSKGAQVTNWARPDLSSSQISYAATDAWISRLLYLKFAGMGLPVDEYKPQEKEEGRRSRNER